MPPFSVKALFNWRRRSSRRTSAPEAQGDRDSAEAIAEEAEAAAVTVTQPQEASEPHLHLPSISDIVLDPHMYTILASSREAIEPALVHPSHLHPSTTTALVADGVISTHGPDAHPTVVGEAVHTEHVVDVTTGGHEE